MDKKIKKEFTDLIENWKHEMESISNGESVTIADIAEILGHTREHLQRMLSDNYSITPKVLKSTQNSFAAWKVDQEKKQNVTRETSSKSNHIATRNKIKNGSRESEGIPIYEEAPFTLTNVPSYRDHKLDQPDFWVTIPGLRKCNYGCRAVGDSMHPLIRSHALVVGEEIVDWQSFFPKGDIYIIRAKNGTETVKYIQPHPSDDTKFLLVPYNKKASTDEIRKEDIMQLFAAKAVFNVL